MIIKAKVLGRVRSVDCRDADCPRSPCWHPHDCPVQGYGGVRESAPRWL